MAISKWEGGVFGLLNSVPCGLITAERDGYSATGLQTRPDNFNSDPDGTGVPYYGKIFARQ